MKKGVFKGISKNIFILGLVSLFTDLSSQMIFPVIPLFLKSALGAGASIVGLVEGSAEATASLFKVVSGYWSDKMKKRKIFVLLGYSLSNLIKPLFALANVWVLVLFVRIIERIGKGVRDAPRDAIVAESADGSIRGKAYGLQRAMDGLGSMLGAVLAFILLPKLGFRKLFLVAFIPGIFAIITIFFVKEKEPTSNKKVVNQTYRASFKELSLNLKLFILASSIFTLGHFGYSFFLLKAKGIGLDDQKSILLYILFYFIYVISSVPFGALSDKVGRKIILQASYLLFVGIAFSLLFVSNIYTLAIFFAIYGIFYAMLDSAQRAFVVDLAPKELKATALGTFYTAIGMVALPGGFLAGFLWDKLSPSATFIYAIILTVISFALLLQVTKSIPKKVKM